jgi:hypothetical protein
LREEIAELQAKVNERQAELRKLEERGPSKGHLRGIDRVARTTGNSMGRQLALGAPGTSSSAVLIAAKSSKAGDLAR